MSDGRRKRPGTPTHRARRPSGRRRGAAPAPQTDPVQHLRRQRLMLASLLENTQARNLELDERVRYLTTLIESDGERNAWLQRFLDVQEFVPVPYLVLTEKLVVSTINTAGLALLGGSVEAVVGRPFPSWFERDSVSAVIRAAQRARLEAAVTVEVVLRTLDGSKPVQVVIRPSKLPGSDAEYFHAAIVDLTEVTRLERQRQRSAQAERVARAASEAKDAFLARLSHELRTPLTPVLAAIEALQADALRPRVKMAIDVIRRNVLAEARLIDDLLDVTRLEQRKLPLERRTIDLNEVVAAVVQDARLVHGEGGIGLDLVLRARPSLVRADAGRLGQVLRNLLSNAVKFSEPGARVEVRTDNVGGAVRVSVIDNGIGMTPRQIDRLFRPLTTVSDESVQRGGLGLGLVISRGLVDAQGGQIRARSAGPGTGTTFEVDLPVVEPPAVPAQETAPAGGRTGAAQRASGTDTTRPAAVAEGGRTGGGRSGAAATGSPAAASDREPQASRLPPAASQPAASLHQPQAAGPGAPTPPRVLLVEDHRDSAEMLSLLLTSEGFSVTVARCVAEARELADSSDVIVSDIALPDGTGLDLVREVRSRRPVRAIALSGFGTSDDAERSLEAGFAVHLTKPVDLSRLVEMVRQLANG